MANLFKRLLLLGAVAYFTMLSPRGEHVSISMEGFVNDGRPTPERRFVGLLNDVLVALGYYESRLLRSVPGGGGDFTAARC